MNATPLFVNGGVAPAHTALIDCTSLIVGKDATVDGSSILSHCEDGGFLGKMERVRARKHQKGTMIPMYNKDLRLSCEIPQVTETYAFTQFWHSEARLGPMWSMPLSGMNEYGLAVVGPLRHTLSEPRTETTNGLLMNLMPKHLHEFALERCKTAREAIRLMGDLVCRYGWFYAGVFATITDGNEAWALEIIGAGSKWIPGCGNPGAVWVAQRIPDSDVCVYANRSRIGEVHLDNPDYFMASPNIYSFAEEMGCWKPGEPFAWYDIYFPHGPDERSSSLREWSALNWVAPSLGLDPEAGRWPFSVKPDRPVSVQDVMAIHRDYLKATPYDITENSAWYVDGKKSPMACPWGSSDLHSLIRVSPERSIGTFITNWTHVDQVRANLPDPIKGCMWLGFGPAATTCFAPVYSGAIQFPESWTNTSKDKVDKQSSWWAFHLVDGLSFIKYQDVIKDIEAVRDPAEACFLARQPAIESAVTALYSNRSQTAAQELATVLVTDYTNTCLNAVSEAWWKLFDYLLFKYYSRVSRDVAQELPVVDCPSLSTIQCQH